MFNKKPISIYLMIAMTWLLVTAEMRQSASMANRQSRHIFMFPQATPDNYLPSFDYEYNPFNLPMKMPTEGSFSSQESESRIPSKFSRPASSPSLYSGDSGPAGGRTFAAFANLFGGRNVPLCPQCPAFPVIPPCPSPTCPPANCPAPTPSTTPSTQGKTTLSFPLQAEECIMLSPTTNIGPCAKVSAASSGDIDVTFTAKDQFISIGIAAVPPNTQIILTCPKITGEVTAITQNGKIAPGSTVTTTGFMQILAVLTGTFASNVITCSWTSTP